MGQVVYLDNNATTPCAPEVVEAMLPYFTRSCGNPSSPHVMGREAASAVETAREQVARAVGCQPGQIVFTSGATESNNLVLLGLEAQQRARRGIVTTAIEHKSVLGPCEFLRSRGLEVVNLPVTEDGVANVDADHCLITEETGLVSVQGANNETGALQPVSALAEIAHSEGAMVHCDATQMLGKVPVLLHELDVDYASFSAHKVYGPKGVGALFVRRGGIDASMSPVFHGGGHERGIRPGTLNVPGVVGFGAACELLFGDLNEEMIRLQTLRDRCERLLLEACPGASVNAGAADRVPGTVSVTFPGVLADALVANCPSVAISTGSACTSGAPGPSHVLLAMGLTREMAECTVRISLGRYNTAGDVDSAARRIIEVVTRLSGTFAEAR